MFFRKELIIYSTEGVTRQVMNYKLPKKSKSVQSTNSVSQKNQTPEIYW